MNLDDLAKFLVEDIFDTPNQRAEAALVGMVKDSLEKYLREAKCGKNMGNDLLVIPCDLPVNHEGPCERNNWPVN